MLEDGSMQATQDPIFISGTSKTAGSITWDGLPINVREQRKEITLFH